MSKLNPLAPWTPSAGPLYTLLSTLHSTLNLPTPSAEYTSWITSLSPLSTWGSVVVAIGTYLAVIFGGRELMRSREPFKLTFLFQCHNLALTIMSAVLLALMAEEIIPMYLKHGFYWSICSQAAWTPRMITFYMANYYIKYVELIDTVFLVLKKKPLAFLHVFHHAATAVLCFTQLRGATSVSWVVISLNLTVHVIMYYYYYATAGGAKIWWKKYLTTLQITQFIIDLFIIYFASYNHFATAYTSLPVAGDCAGAESAALFGCMIITSYLFLFIGFYRATYKKTGDSGKAAKKLPRKIANGSASGLRS